MTILEKMECPTSNCYCGSACFCSLLAYVNLLEEERRARYSSLLFRMMDLDGDYFLASKEEKERLLPELEQGYGEVLSFVGELKEKAKEKAVKEKLREDEKFLLHLRELVEEG